MKLYLNFLILVGALLFSVPVFAQVTEPPKLPEASSDIQVESVVRGKDDTVGVTEFSQEDLMLQQFEEQEAAMKKVQEKQKELSFDSAKEQLLPLTPEQIEEFLDYFYKSRAAAENVDPVPTPRVHVETVSLDPGVAPPVLNTAVGHVSTLTVLDITGAPWPIQDVSWGGEFNVIVPENGGHIIRISPLTAHGIGNISMRLAELETPVTFMLKTGPDIVHYRFDARIPKFGPLAETPIIDNGGLTAIAGDETLTMVLDGVPPQGAQVLDVNGVDGRTRVWKISKEIFVRTPLTLLSPSWKKSVSSADGTKVYALDAAPVLLLSERGQIVRAHIGTGGTKK